MVRRQMPSPRAELGRERFEVTASHLVAWSIIVALQGLLLGSLDASLYLLAAGVVVVMLARLLGDDLPVRATAVRRGTEDRRAARSELLAKLAVAAVPLTLLLTPAWNFQWGWQWDQGLYEVYANHFASSGTFFWDISPELRILGDRAAWLTGPTTFFELVGGIGDEPLRGTRLPGYAVWLALVKSAIGITGPVWIGNVSIATLVTLLLHRVTRLAGADRWPAVLITMTITANIAFLYNAKQFVAEPLGLLGILLIIVGVLEATPSQTQRVSLVFSGTLLTLITKIDGWQPVLILIGILALAAVRDRSLRPLVLSMLVATATATAQLPSLTTASYLRTLRLPSEVRSIMPLDGQALAIALVILLAGMTMLAWLPYSDRAGAWVLRMRGAKRAALALDATVALGWIAFGVWAWRLRAQGLEFGDMTPREIADRFNLPRLIELWSPVAIAVVFIGLLAPLRSVRGPVRALSLGLALAFALVVIDARNQPSELWWVRRYFLSFAPLAALTLGPVVDQISVRGQLLAARVAMDPATSRRISAAVVASVLGLGVALQATTLPPLLRATQNEGLDVIVREVLEHVPDGVPLIVAATTLEVKSDELMLGTRDRVTQGVATAVRAARTDLTLIEVPEWEVGCIAREIGGDVAVLSRIGPTGTPQPFGEVIAAGTAEVRFPLWRTRFVPDAPPRGAERDYEPFGWELSIVGPVDPGAATESEAPAPDRRPQMTIPLRTFVGFGDTNGLIHWLGTRGSRSAPHDSFCNPGRLDPSLLSASSVLSGDGSDEQARGATDRSTGATLPGQFVVGQTFHSLEQPDAWWQLDLGEGETFAPELFTVRQRRNVGPTPHLLRDLVLEGSSDGASWVTLVTGRHLGDVGDWQAFPVRAADGYRYLRLRQTGPAEDGLPYLVFADIELYGDLISSAGDR